MRTHFPGVLHEVRSAARFPLAAAGRVDAGEWRASASAAGGDWKNGKPRRPLIYEETPNGIRVPR